MKVRLVNSLITCNPIYSHYRVSEDYELDTLYKCLGYTDIPIYTEYEAEKNYDKLINNYNLYITEVDPLDEPSLRQLRDIIDSGDIDKFYNKCIELLSELESNGSDNI